MTTPFWCLLIVLVMPYVLAGLGGALRVKQLGSLDNNHPRVQAQELRGVAARAYAAQQNAWEAVSFFGTAVVINHLAGGAPGTSATLAMVYVAARLGHAAAYLADQPILRTIVFLVSLVCGVWLIVLGINA